MSRILLLSPFPPGRGHGGVTVRIDGLARQLATRFPLWLAARGPALADASIPGLQGCFAAPGSRTRWLLDPSWLLRLALWVKRNRIDTVISSSLISGLHGWLLARLTGCRWVLDQHNHESKLVPAWTAAERWLCRRADQVWACSLVDAASLRLLSGRPVEVVPNGAVQQAPLDSNSRALVRFKFGCNQRPVALFFGTLGYAPNQDALRVLETELAPRLPGWDWVIAGHADRPPTLVHCRFLGFVPDLDQLLQAVDVVVVPLLRGSGTRLKILEALAAGCPVVSTGVGAEGLPAHQLAPLLQVSSDWSDFLKKVAESPTIQRLTPAAMQSFSWQAVGDQLQRLLNTELEAAVPKTEDVAHRDQR